MATKKEMENEVVIPGFLRFSKVLVWIMYFWVLIGVISLTLRTILLALSANTSAGFANFVITISNDYMQPFRGIFTGREVGETGYLDVSAIFAIIVYLFIAWGFHALIDFVQNKIDFSEQEQKDAIRKRKLEAQRQEALRAQQKRTEALKRSKTTTTTTVSKKSV